jgi:hypothetical protein
MLYSNFIGAFSKEDGYCMRAQKHCMVYELPLVSYTVRAKIAQDAEPHAAQKTRVPYQLS